MTQRLRIRGRYRARLDEDQLALAYLMLAKLLSADDKEQRAQPGSPNTPVRRKAAS
jgi:hypothetical protein